MTVVTTFVLGVIWRIHFSAHPVDRATVYTAYLAAAALGVTLMMLLGTWWKRQPGIAATLGDRQELSGVARVLAQRSSTQESVQQRRLLADSGLPQPADTEFNKAELVFWREDGGDVHGSLADIAGYYSRLELRRLVILGAAGAGKSVLASQLLIDLIRSSDSLAGGMPAVPIRLSLAAFDPGSNPWRAESGELAARLDNWITSQLTMSPFELSHEEAAALVRAGRILPVLDGLDETDPPDQPPIREVAIVRALNHPVGSVLRPVVLTCRTDTYYGQLASLRAPPGYGTTLQNATTVIMLPLTPSKIGRYLTRRFHDRGQIQPRWQPVIDHLRGPLGEVLSSPLNLFLAVTAYHDDDTDPAELTQLPADLVRASLLDHLIPAIASRHPAPGGGRYRPGDVRAWLATLAAHLQDQQQAGGNSTDIELHHLWTAAGPGARYITAALYSLLTVVPVSVGWLLGGNTDVLSLVEVIVLAFCFTYAKAARLPVEFTGRFTLSKLRGRPDLRRPPRSDNTTKSVRRRSSRRDRLKQALLTSSLAGLILGLLAARYATGSDASRARWIAVFAAGPLVLYLLFRLCGLVFRWLGILIILPAVLAFDLMKRTMTAPTAVARPSEFVIDGVIGDLTFGVTWSVFLGLASGVLAGVAGLIFDLGWGGIGVPGAVLSATLIGWLFIGLPVGMYLTAGSPWPRYLMAARILARRNQLPAKPARFLDWAYDAGLLRLSGVAAQFRHRDLQNHLVPDLQSAARPTVTPDPTSPTAATSASPHTRTADQE